MAESLVIRTNNAGAYLYIEDDAGNSLAIGLDDATNTFNINSLPTPNAIPDESTSNFAIDPAANGDIVLLPNGTGTSVFADGDVRVSTGDVNLTLGDVNLSAGNVEVPSPNAALTQGS